jgi:D-alanine-D-alanine ligase
VTIKVGILFGGQSGEHEVSVQSALNVRAALDTARFAPVFIGIDKKGIWRLDAPGHPLLTDTKPQIVGDQGVVVIPGPSNGSAELRDAETGKILDSVDVFFPIAHGTFGEDGCLQGMLRLLGVPFVGASVLGSAVGMDKDVMKRLFRDAGLPIGRFVTIREYEREQVSYDVLARQLGLPLFVKPCNLGSSVGISKVESPEEWDAALKMAFRYDTKVIVEEFIKGREIECSVLGEQPPRAALPGEVEVHDAPFYDYDTKYVNEEHAILHVPAKLEPETIREIQHMAVRVFEVVECAGLARVDFFLREDGKVLVSEINTLPGFTRISMYPKLWDASGLPYGALLTRLIELALERFQLESRICHTFDGE